MTQVSRIPLQKEVEKRVYEVLMECVMTTSTHDSVDHLLTDLLSPTERLMIAKRLAIALLLLKGYEQRVISHWLKVSLATVSKVSLAIQRGNNGYRIVIGSLLKKEKLEKFIQKIDDTLADLMPPMGKNWANWRRARWKKKVESQKIF